MPHETYGPLPFDSGDLAIWVFIYMRGEVEGRIEVFASNKPLACMAAGAVTARMVKTDPAILEDFAMLVEPFGPYTQRSKEDGTLWRFEGAAAVSEIADRVMRDVKEKEAKP